MTKLAIDTNAYRALRDANPKVEAALRNRSVIGLPIIVLGELYHGIEKGIKKESNASKLSHFLEIQGVEILNINHDTARIFGEISAELAIMGQPIQQNDVWIAALCKQYNYTLLTGDKGFSSIKGLDTITF